jgi:signal transduction histidine kinase
MRTAGTARVARHLMELDVLSLSLSRRVALAAAFCSSYAALVLLGFLLKENPDALTIIWPAEGLLVVALWWIRYERWPFVLALEIVAEQAVTYAIGASWGIAWDAVFVLANFVNAAVAAALLKLLIARPSHPHVAQVVRAIAILALGAAVGALLGAWAATGTYANQSYFTEWQVWWAGNLLGTLAVGPLLLVWAIRFRVPALFAGNPRLPALLMLGAALIGATVWIFYVPEGSGGTLLHLPFVLILLVVACALALPPRWAMTLAAASALVAAWLASRGSGPFAGDTELLTRVGTLQWFIAALVTLPFLIATALLERQRTGDRLRESEERYRSFVALSSEAVWRVEIVPPLPLDLPGSEQVAWLQKHSHIAECNLVFERLGDKRIETLDNAPFRCEVPWSRALLEALPAMAVHQFTMTGLQFGIRDGESVRHLLADFRAVVENGHVVRIWGIARDVSEIVSLALSVEKERAKLAEYARQLTTAEDRARREIAVDLHDGIGQLIMAQSMQLALLLKGLPDDHSRQVADLQKTNAEIHDATRRIMAELSPPGLYEVGLTAALQWLADQYLERDSLAILIESNIDNRRIDIDTRILLYRVLVELLRNVVKHAHTNVATVRLTMSDSAIVAEAIDDGIGFMPQSVLLDSGSSRFGLWSVNQRVADAGGRMNIDADVGHGCRITVELPLATQ